MLGNTRVDAATDKSGEEAGIIPNAVADVFAVLKEENSYLQKDEAWTVKLSYLEVYNEQVYDLLESTGKVLSVREDQIANRVVVAGLTEVPVVSYSEVMEYLLVGNGNRKTEATMANNVSSRSHAVLQIVLKRRLLRKDSGKESVMEAKLSLIDLAGSERASATNNRGERLQVNP